MAQIHFLGTCSGTEPQPDRRHTSFVLEIENRVYIFDAGESCGYTAQIMGIDLLALDAVFISHPHMDHIGGLPHLLWTIKKLEALSKKPQQREIKLYLPNIDIWLGLEKLLFLKGRAIKGGLEFTPQRIKDGVIYNNNVVVKALHNLHFGRPEPDGSWQSFSFLITAAGKRIVYSGDFKTMHELAPLLTNIDLLLVETGHHSVEEVCGYLKTNAEVKQVVFVHHGRAILADAESELEKAKAIFGPQVLLAQDAMSITL